MSQLLDSSNKRLAGGERDKWHHLHGDICKIIEEKLQGLDRISYNFGLKYRSPRLQNMLPWVLTIKRKNCGASAENVVQYGLYGEDIYDPFEQKVYKIGKFLLKPKQQLFRVHASRYGWLFVVTRNSSDQPTYIVSNIFTNELITLPKLQKEKEGGPNIALNISTSPTLPDCIFFVVGQDSFFDIITISLYRIGDQEWTTYPYGGCPSRIEDMIYNNGKLYCVFDSYDFGIFEEANHSWTMLSIDTSSFISTMTFGDKWRKNKFKNRLVVFNEEILLVHSDIRWKWGVYKFDQEKTIWVEKTSFGNKSIFIGDEGDEGTSFSIPVHKSLVDRVYFNGPRKSSYYKVKNRSGNSGHTLFYRPTCERYLNSTKEHYTRIWMYPSC